MRDQHVISVGFQINREFGLSIFGLNGTYLYSDLNSLRIREHWLLFCDRHVDVDLLLDRRDLLLRWVWTQNTWWYHGPLQCSEMHRGACCSWFHVEWTVATSGTTKSKSQPHCNAMELEENAMLTWFCSAFTYFVTRMNSDGLCLPPSVWFVAVFTTEQVPLLAEKGHFNKLIPQCQEGRNFRHGPITSFAVFRLDCIALTGRCLWVVHCRLFLHRLQKWFTPVFAAFLFSWILSVRPEAKWLMKEDSLVLWRHSVHGNAFEWSDRLFPPTAQPKLQCWKFVEKRVHCPAETLSTGKSCVCCGNLFWFWRFCP